MITCRLSCTSALHALNQHHHTIQYNTIQPSFVIAVLTLKFRSALRRLGGADAVVLQSNYVRRTCSRSLHSNCLRRGSNPHSLRYRPSPLTNRPPCQTMPSTRGDIFTSFRFSFIRSFILKTYIAPRQETATQLRNDVTIHCFSMEWEFPPFPSSCTKSSNFSFTPSVPMCSSSAWEPVEDSVCMHAMHFNKNTNTTAYQCTIHVILLEGIRWLVAGVCVGPPLVTLSAPYALRTGLPTDAI